MSFYNLKTSLGIKESLLSSSSFHDVAFTGLRQLAPPTRGVWRLRGGPLSFARDRRPACAIWLRDSENVCALSPRHIPLSRHHIQQPKISHQRSNSYNDVQGPHDHLTFSCSYIATASIACLARCEGTRLSRSQPAGLTARTAS